MAIGFEISGTNITTATIRPDNDLSRTTTPKVRITKFGNGYEQRGKMGLNHLEETYAVRFENILQLCNLNLDGIGASNGTIVPGSGARMIKCIDQFGEDFSSYIVRAVSFMRDKWGTEESPLLNIEDSMVHGLTTLFVFLDNAGKVEGGTTNGLNGKKKHFEQWMNVEMGRTSMRKYYHNTAGGNTQFKICHQIIKEYNFWAQENAPTMTISNDCLHQNGILNPNVMLTKQDRKQLPSFPSDIVI